MRDAELTHEERSLIATARNAGGPTEIQRVRVRRGLDAKIAAGVAAPVMGTSVGFAALLKVGVGVAFAAVVGGGAIYLAAPRAPVPTAAPPAPPARSVRRPVPMPEVEAKPAIEPVPPAAVETPASRPRGKPHPREANPLPTAPSDLTGELGLLSQASAATRQGDAARADHLLRTYDERYPSGQLAQERAAAGVLAHCAAGRIPLARAEARLFLERWPRSPLAARIRISCAGEAKSP